MVHSIYGYKLVFSLLVDVFSAYLLDKLGVFVHTVWLA